MINNYKTDGIILSRRNIGEADKLVTFFSKDFGKKTVIAKGIRRITSRRASHLELFLQVSLVLHRGKTWDLLTEVETIESYSHIRSKLERLGFTYIALELTEKLTAENQESVYIFDRLHTFLSTLNDVSTTRNAALLELNDYKQALLAELGFIIRDVPYTQQLLDEKIHEVLEMSLKSSEVLTNIQSIL